MFKDALEQVTAEISGLREENKQIRETIDNIQEDVNELQAKHNNLEMKWDEKYSSLELKCDDLEQESRLTSVIILNEWVEQPTESTATMAKQYIQEALHIDVHDNDILKCFRIGRKNRTDRIKSPRPILVKFSSISLKTEVLLARRRLRKFVSDRYTRPVFINEDLTATRQKIYSKCRLLKKSGKIKDCWTQNGRIFAKYPDDRIKPVDQNEVKDLSEQN